MMDKRDIEALMKRHTDNLLRPQAVELQDSKDFLGDSIMLQALNSIINKSEEQVQVRKDLLAKEILEFQFKTMDSIIALTIIKMQYFVCDMVLNKK